MRQSISQDLLVSQVASFFGALALALAALGLYGVMMYATLRRTSEFGLRMALGADAGRVRSMVLGEAMALVVGGTVVGVPLAIVATRLLRNQLYGVRAAGPGIDRRRARRVGGERGDRRLCAGDTCRESRSAGGVANGLVLSHRAANRRGHGDRWASVVISFRTAARQVTQPTGARECGSNYRLAPIVSARISWAEAH